MHWFLKRLSTKSMICGQYWCCLLIGRISRVHRVVEVLYKDQGSAPSCTGFLCCHSSPACFSAKHPGNCRWGDFQCPFLGVQTGLSALPDPYILLVLMCWGHMAWLLVEMPHVSRFSTGRNIKCGVWIFTAWTASETAAGGTISDAVSTMYNLSSLWPMQHTGSYFYDKLGCWK